jgi:biotin transport system substrate-specific component
MTNAVSTPQAASRAVPIKLRAAAALAGALAVAAAAQLSIPVPGSPVPFSLQPFAVLVVGGLLGARYGALSLALYLVLGAAGLPVFAPFGAPGVARLIGPTGGFLVAYPFAAATAGALAGSSYWRNLLAAFAGMVVIFAGGLAQLAILTDGAIARGFTPFVAADLVKVVLAALVLRRFHSATRALR